MAVPPDEVILTYKFLSVLCHTLNNPLEHSRATDDTTCGIKSLFHVNVALHEDLERKKAVPPESTASEIQLLTDANVTFHDALERNGRAACVEAFGANSDDVPMLLRICDAKLEEVSGPRDTVSSQVFKPKRNFLGTPKDGVNAGVPSPR